MRRSSGSADDAADHTPEDEAAKSMMDAIENAALMDFKERTEGNRKSGWDNGAQDAQGEGKGQLERDSQPRDELAYGNHKSMSQSSPYNQTKRSRNHDPETKSVEVAKDPSHTTDPDAGGRGDDNRRNPRSSSRSRDRGDIEEGRRTSSRGNSEQVVGGADSTNAPDPTCQSRPTPQQEHLVQGSYCITSSKLFIWAQLKLSRELNLTFA
jgi:hypothetical protein